MSTGPEPPLTRVRRAVRAILWLSIAVSIVANVLDAQKNGTSQAIHAWPPLALFLAVELISRVPIARVWLARVRAGAATVIALIAAWISYWHMVTVAARYGEKSTSAHLLPFTVDALIVVASICLVELNARLRAARDAAAVTAYAEEITRLAAQLDAARADAQNERAAREVTARGARDAREAEAATARHARTMEQERDAARAELDVARAAQPRTVARTPRADDTARRAHWRALRTAHADESAARLRMRWDTSAHGEPPALRTLQDWTRANDAPRVADSAQ